MDKRTTIKNKLNPIFSDLSKGERKYSEVWLSDVNFGELYHPNLYVLNVKVEHQIDNSRDEIYYILEILDKKAKEELQSIWQLRIFGLSDEVYCASDEVLVYSDTSLSS